MTTDDRRPYDLVLANARLLGGPELMDIAIRDGVIVAITPSRGTFSRRERRTSAAASSSRPSRRRTFT